MFAIICQSWNRPIEVIEPGFGIVDVPAITEGVQYAKRGSQGTGDCGDFSPAIVLVMDLRISTLIVDGDHVALQVIEVISVAQRIADGVIGDRRAAVVFYFFVSKRSFWEIATLEFFDITREQISE